MRVDRRIRPAAGKQSGRTKNNGKSLAQRRVDGVGLWFGIMFAAMFAYIALCETGVL